MKSPDINEYRKRIIVVYSPGGGNGKSEIAANLAFCLSAKGKRTWLLDSNLFAPTQDVIFGLSDPGPTFAEYVATDHDDDEIPCYDLASALPQWYSDLHLFLTPSRRDDAIVRFQLQECINGSREIFDKIPEKIFQTMQNNEIDTLIIDTYPGFDQINEVWLGLTEFLLIVSRMNDIDKENLKVLLQDGNVSDIRRSLVVFNNVQLDNTRKAFKTMDNHTFADNLDIIRSEISSMAGPFEEDGGDKGVVDIFESPFLYSEQLALYSQDMIRNGLFIQHEPDNTFSQNVWDLTDYILDNGYIG
jgi:MinD-like ATPase involved in chromosome partitioning or flagellar assembly